MTKGPKFTHLVDASQNRRYIRKAACGAQIRQYNLCVGDLDKPAEVAGFIARMPYLPPMCPKCAALALIAESASVTNAE